jgi:type VI secretion system ImpH/TssG family protein
MASVDRDARAAVSLLGRAVARPGRASLLSLVDRLTRSGHRIRLRHDHGLGFRAAEVSAMRVMAREEGADAGPADVEITATILGVSGANGPAPLYLRELLAEASDAGELRRELLDLFHHRLYTLLIEGITRLTPQRSAGLAEDPWPAGIAAWLGLSELNLRALSPMALVRVAPLLVARERGPSALSRGLRRLLGGRLGGAALTIEERVGGWSPIQGGGQMRLGSPSTTELGRSTTIGGWCRDPAAVVRIRIGPLPAERLPAARPGGELHDALCDALMLLNRDVVEFHLVVELIGAISPSLGRARLGADYRLTAPDQGARELCFPLAVSAVAS